MFNFIATAGYLVAALALVGAIPIINEDELVNLSPKANLYGGFCLSQRKAVLEEIGQAYHEDQLGALNGLYITGDEIGKDEIVIRDEPSGKRSFAETLAQVMGIESPIATSILIGYRKKSESNDGRDTSAMDVAYKANCEVFSKLAAVMREDFAVAKAHFKGDVELEQLGCRTVNRILRLAHICSFVSESVTKPKQRGLYVPNRLLI